MLDCGFAALGFLRHFAAKMTAQFQDRNSEPPHAGSCLFNGPAQTRQAKGVELPTESAIGRSLRPAYRFDFGVLRLTNS